MENIRIVQALYDYFATDNREAIREIFDPQISWNQMEGFPGGGNYIGADEIFIHVFDNFKKAWTVWKATVNRYFQSEDAVIATGYYEGTYLKTGRSMKAAFAGEYIIKSGKITAFYQYTDTLLISQAMEIREIVSQTGT